MHIAEAENGHMDWDSVTPMAPPGLEEYAAQWLGWAFWVAAVVAVIALVASGIMMMIGRFSGRGAVSADGLRQSIWVYAGAMVVAISISVVRGILG